MGPTQCRKRANSVPPTAISGSVYLCDSHGGCSNAEEMRRILHLPCSQAQVPLHELRQNPAKRSLESPASLVEPSDVEMKTESIHCWKQEKNLPCTRPNKWPRTLSSPTQVLGEKAEPALAWAADVSRSVCTGVGKKLLRWDGDDPVHVQQVQEAIRATRGSPAPWHKYTLIQQEGSLISFMIIFK